MEMAIDIAVAQRPRAAVMLISDLDDDPNDLPALTAVGAVAQHDRVPIRIVGLSPSPANVAYFRSVFGRSAPIVEAPTPAQAARAGADAVPVDARRARCSRPPPRSRCARAGRRDSAGGGRSDGAAARRDRSPRRGRRHRGPAGRRRPRVAGRARERRRRVRDRPGTRQVDPRDRISATSPRRCWGPPATSRRAWRSRAIVRRRASSSSWATRSRLPTQRLAAINALERPGELSESAGRRAGADAARDPDLRRGCGWRRGLADRHGDRRLY